MSFHFSQSKPTMRAHIVATLADVIKDLATNQIDSEQACGRLVALVETCGGDQLTLKAGGEAIASPALSDRQRLTNAIQKVFDQWRRLTDRPKASLTPQRSAKIRARLQEGRTVADLVDAIHGAMMSEHHVSGGYTDIVTIFKNATSLEQHLERKRGNAGEQRSIAATTSPEVAALRDGMAQAKAAGDRKLYADLRARLTTKLEEIKRIHG